MKLLAIPLLIVSSLHAKTTSSFLILFSVINDKYKEIMPILGDKNKLWSEVEQVCREKYQQLSSRYDSCCAQLYIYFLDEDDICPYP